jgi:LPXTG-motif cell wall-anchored protein
LAGVASAHTAKPLTGCAADGQATVSIDAEQYAVDTKNHNKTPNTITFEVDGTVVKTDTFGTTYISEDIAGKNVQPLTIDGTKEHAVVVSIKAFDDPGDGRFSPTFHLTTKVCEQGTPKPPPPTKPSPTTTTAPPTTTTTTTKAVVPPPATTTTTPKTAAAVKELPNTGVSAGVPLALGGALVLAGGGLLFGMRMSARRRHQG